MSELFFVSPFKCGTVSVSRALELLYPTYKVLGHSPSLFTSEQYELIGVFNKIVDSYVYARLIPKDMVEEIKQGLGFVVAAAQGYNIYQDWPLGHECIHPFIKKLLFPRCKLIFLERDMGSWSISCKNWVLNHPDLYPFGHFINLYPLITQRERELDMARWKKMYERLQKDYPCDVLIMNVKQGWEPLCHFVSKPVPNTYFPRLNTAESQLQLPVETKQLPVETKQMPLATKQLPVEIKQQPPLTSKQLPVETQPQPVESKQQPSVESKQPQTVAISRPIQKWVIPQSTSTLQNIDIVVARYNEDLTWLKDVVSGLTNVQVFVYNKGLDDIGDIGISYKLMFLANMGREADSYLAHIEHNYERYTHSYDHKVIFTQGNMQEHISGTPQGHVRLLLDHAHDQARSHAVGTPHAATYNFTIGEYKGKLAPAGLVFGDWFTKYVSPIFPDPVLWWVAAIFCVEANMITSKPLLYYKTLREQVNYHNCPEQAHFLERAWYYVFMPYLKVITCTSDNYKPVYDVFYNSLRPLDHNMELVVHTLDLSMFKTFGFGADSWHYAMESKINFVVNQLEETMQGEYIVVTDADIQFFEPRKLHYLVQQARIKGLDYYGMQENDKDMYNGGFYIICVNEKTLAFYKQVYEMMTKHRYPYGDQTVINELLPKSKVIKHAKIPRELCTWGGHTPTPHSIFHHATCTHTIQEKLDMMKNIKARWLKSKSLSTI